MYAQMLMQSWCEMPTCVQLLSNLTDIVARTKGGVYPYADNQLCTGTPTILRRFHKHGQPCLEYVSCVPLEIHH
jgi:hypothetical protein